MSDDIKNAPMQAMKNRKSLQGSDLCGCYHCIKTFKPDSITKWTDQNQTALCPFCEVDSVVPFNDVDKLSQANKYWFKEI